MPYLNWKLKLIGLTFLLFTNYQILGNPAGADNETNIDTSKVVLLRPDVPLGQRNLSEAYHQTAGEKLDKPFLVQVKYNNQPVKNWRVIFSIISIPARAEGAHLTKDTVYTDENGLAETEVVLGSKSGKYEFSARILGDPKYDIVYFNAYARASDWIFFLISGLIGGLAMFLFGMNMMSEGLKKTAGSRMRDILGSITNNRIVAVGVGTFITIVIQSSSATTVMLVSFVQAQLMTFAQSLGIILGADIGTTVTAQLIAFKLTDYALLIIGLGFAFIFFGKKKKVRNLGSSILGFGILFFGMWVMSNAMHPLQTYEPFLNILMKLEHPLLGILVGTIFTALIQSSGAFAGIIIVLGSQGLLTLDAAIPLLLGANIGTSITAALASIGTSREAKRVALAHTLFKIFGVALFAWWIPYYADFVRAISPSGAEELTGNALLSDVLPRQIANAHTVFNVVLTLIVLPFTGAAARLILRILPDKIEPVEEGEFKTRYLEESLISTPVLALNLAKAEIINMAGKVQMMVDKIIHCFFKNDEDLVEEIKEMETEVNFLNVRINNYLVKVSQESLHEERIDEIFQMMHSVTELEQIGDVVSKRLIPLAEKKMALNAEFSEEGKSEIMDYHLRTMKQISRAIEVFKDVNLKGAKRMEKKYKKYRLMEMDLRRTHFTRLQNELPQTVATSEIHLELIEMLKRISSHATNIARILLELRSEKEEEANLKVQLSRIEKKKRTQIQDLDNDDLSNENGEK